jgi:hypothetical protein
VASAPKRGERVSGLTEQQVHDLLHRIDAMIEEILDRSERASGNHNPRLATVQAAKAGGLLKAFRAVQFAAGIDAPTWAHQHLKTPGICGVSAGDTEDLARKAIG